MKQTFTATIREGLEIVVADAADIARVLSEARAVSKSRGMLGIITFESKPGGFLSLVVGGQETVLAFQEDLDPPYYASKGAAEAEQPILECFMHFEHHTEFSRNTVIASADGERAAFEFFETRRKPQCIRWQEV